MILYSTLSVSLDETRSMLLELSAYPGLRLNQTLLVHGTSRIVFVAYLQSYSKPLK